MADEAFDSSQHRGDEPHLLREILRTYQVLMAGLSRKTGMPGSRFALMRSIAVSEGEAGVMDLARQLGINASAVTRQIKEMEQESLVVRRSDPRDRRRISVRLSPKGRKVFSEIHQRNHELERALSSILKEEEIAVAVRVLTRLRGFIEGR
jgi:DNA-binding MarR family transcriptional regulator